MPYPGEAGIQFGVRIRLPRRHDRNRTPVSAGVRARSKAGVPIRRFVDPFALPFDPF